MASPVDRVAQQDAMNFIEEWFHGAFEIVKSDVKEVSITTNVDSAWSDTRILFHAMKSQLQAKITYPDLTADLTADDAIWLGAVGSARLRN